LTRWHLRVDGVLEASSQKLEDFSVVKCQRRPVGEVAGESSQNTGDCGSLRSLHFPALHEPKETWITAETKQPLNKEQANEHLAQCVVTRESTFYIVTLRQRRHHRDRKCQKIELELFCSAVTEWRFDTTYNHHML